VDNLGSSQQLHHQPRGDDGTNTQLHQRSSVGGQNDSQPVKRIGRVGRVDSVQRHLSAHQKDEQSHRSPQQSLVELDLRGERKKEEKREKKKKKKGKKEKKKKNPQNRRLTGFNGLLISGTMAINGLNNSSTRTSKKDAGE
jgi:hypothetical protein